MSDNEKMNSTTGFTLWNEMCETKEFKMFCLGHGLPTQIEEFTDPSDDPSSMGKPWHPEVVAFLREWANAIAENTR